MPRTYETSPLPGEAGRARYGGQSPGIPNPTFIQVQFLIAAHAIRLELAAMLAALVFGGHGA